ncbi:MAG: sulfurtransferase/chromate resistance protein [Gammaproteobacteria bacterium]|nr:sulfurtransferase/chromate resistance protein [Gammaproteobacteria bacterium]
MPSPNQITVSQLARLIGTPAAPVLIDVRIDEDFEFDPDLVPGAFRHPHDSPEVLLDRLSGQRVVVYCQKGRKLSQGFVALLRCHGIAAESLEGGHFGWRDAGLPRLRADLLPAPGAIGGTRWVTRHRPKVDRLACPWLIRRFIDPAASFLFVAPSEVLAVAEKFDATPFDVEDVFWSHRGDRCTFDTLIDEFGLEFDALARLATIVRAADTNRLELAPQAHGLLAASLGLSRMYRDDIEMLDAGMTLYDAFFRWARDATDETHDWPLARDGGRT